MFTPRSRARRRAEAAAADTFAMEIIGRLVFMAAVTCYLLGRLFAGEASHPEAAVYAATAAFGLEFLTAYWRSLWGTS
jgi:hypothetical protein